MLVLIYGLLFVTGLGVWITSVMQGKDAFLSRRWPSTQGQIDQVEVVYHGGGGPGTTNPYTKGSYAVKVAYSYWIAGQAYHHHRRCFGDYGGSEQRANKIAEYYRTTQQVTVYYHPQNPGVAVLEPGPRVSQLLPLLIAAVLMAGGALGIIKSI